MPRAERGSPDRTGRVLTTRAHAKINLTLHVTGQRADGRHLLDSLVAFADGLHDTLCVRPGDRLRLTVDGPMADGVPGGADNLVLRAARLLAPDRGASIRLTKRLPNRAGIGGGSADAAAALRLLSAHWGIAAPEDVSVLGADVPVCRSAVPQRMRGAGECLAPLPGLPETWLVLVNPGVSVPTGAVFAALEAKANPPMPVEIPGFRAVADFAEWLGGQRNDLEGPARGIAPEIADVLAALAAQDGALLARMSGSGATCFGIYAGARAAERAAERIARDHPDWWVRATALRRG